MHLTLRPRLSERDYLAFTAWQVASVLLVYVVPSMFRLHDAPFARGVVDAFQAWVWTACYLLFASSWHLVSTWLGMQPRRAWTWLIAVTVIAAVCWGSGWLVLSTRDDAARSRIMAAVAVSLGTVLALAPQVLGRLLRKASVALAGLAVVSATGAAWAASDEQDRPLRMTALVPVLLTSDQLRVDSIPLAGGALTPFRNGFLLVSGAGSVYELSWNAEDRTRIQPRRLTLPPLPTGGPIVEGPVPGKVPLLRAMGIAVDTTGPRPVLFVSHERWHDNDRCLTTTISSIELDAPGGVAPWSTIFSSQPCLKPEGVFDRLESGGRLRLRPDGRLLLTLGDYGFSAAGAELAQSDEADYGKVLMISRDGTYEVLSRGHRNPQGLMIDSAGRFWSTEHGPQGGDELNLLRRGANYGWPLMTYGTPYGALSKSRPEPGPDADLEAPVHAFVPSIGVSNLIQVRGPEFAPWSGDLLVGSLRAAALYRVHLEGTTAVYRETIPVGVRVRDLAESTDGGIVLWTDRQTLVSLRVSRADSEGAVAFLECATCHSTQRAPDLFGLVGRRIASTPYPYSPALRRLRGRWTASRLDDFLRDPAAYAPGIQMDFDGITDDRVRAALVRYLEQFR